MGAVFLRFLWVWRVERLTEILIDFFILTLEFGDCSMMLVLSWISSVVLLYGYSC